MQIYCYLHPVSDEFIIDNNNGVGDHRQFIHELVHISVTIKTDLMPT